MSLTAPAMVKLEKMCKLTFLFKHLAKNVINFSLALK